MTADGGTFNIPELTATRQYSGSYQLNGSVINNTSKTWESAAFKVELLDSDGRQVATTTVRFFAALPPGAQKKISAYEASGDSIYTSSRAVASMRVSFDGGTRRTDYVFALAKPTTVASPLAFSDQYIDILFQPTARQIGFTLRNKTAAPIKVDWNSAAYVDIAGSSHRVIHEGVKLIDRSSLLAPTVIPPQASITDLVYPSSYVSYTSGRYGGWNEQPLFPQLPLAQSFKGKSFSVFLPLEVGGQVRNYSFPFLIQDVRD